MNRIKWIEWIEPIKNFFFNYIGHGSIAVVLFLLSIYFVLTKTGLVFEHKKSDWIKNVNKFMGDKKSGKFLAKDKQGNYVILEWERVAPKGKKYQDNMKSVSDLFCLSRINEQLAFWRKYPEKCPESLKVFLSNGPKKDGASEIDKNLKDQACPEFLQKALLLSKLEFYPDFSDSDDVVFFVKLFDKATNKMLGAAIFGIGGQYNYGDIFIRDIVSSTTVRDKGLGTLLASAIFKIVPNIKRIRVYVLLTNFNAMVVYSSWDFYKQEVDVNEAKEGCLLMEYDIENSRYLQKVAERLQVVI